jgi:enterochelin esterase-like enzyme
MYEKDRPVAAQRSLQVGVGGLEPPTPASQTRCAGRLRYTPVLLEYNPNTMRSSRRTSTANFLSLLVMLIVIGCVAPPAAGGDSVSNIREVTVSLPVPPGRTASPLPTWTVALPTPTPTVRPSTTLAPSPNPTITPTTCPQTTGRVEQGQIISSILNRPLDFRVYLPPCYAPERTGGYPVLYLLHGQSMDDSGWDLFGADETATALIASGEVNPFLIVMPREDYYLQDISQSAFGRALLEDLLPWIETNYAACPQRTCRAIGGLSRGAVWAMLVALEHQTLFGSAGGHSLPSAIFSPYYLRTLWESMPENERIRLYLDIGEFDRYRSGAEEFHQRLDFLNIPHEWNLNPGTHNDEYWMSHVEDYLRWYAANW